MNKLCSLSFAFFCVFITATTWAAAPIAMYSIIEIPSIVAGGSMSASAINARGDVVGKASGFAFFSSTAAVQ